MTKKKPNNDKKKKSTKCISRERGDKKDEK